MHQPIFFVDCSSLFVNNSVHIIGCSLENPSIWLWLAHQRITPTSTRSFYFKIPLYVEEVKVDFNMNPLLSISIYKQFWKIYSHWLFLSALLRLVVCGPLQSLMLLADQTRNFPKWPRPRKWMIKESCNLGTDYKTVSLNYK